MKIGVKFCGGCNPGYERFKIVKKLCKEFPYVFVEPVQEGITYDLILLISGCHAECLSILSWQQIAPVIAVYEQIDYEKIKKYLCNRNRKKFL